ncbi:Six-hairpin glycosidase [Teratosphaeria destructans]|uniref:Six-hairpin glycosidase n=1 Tax=Teratosphaeria destructans TaxID=418781 RepID=A0A9W7W212_9PEZI|nr:Six-hairpin glycosidase [Teratosphaeria destructans]
MMGFTSAALWLLVTIDTALAANPRPYPLADSYLQTTSFLDHSSYIQDLDDHQWYLDNIPFIDVPDHNIQEVYYYRASVIKRHLKWAHEGHGWVETEFIHPVSWASKFQTIPDSAGHHVVELRWLRDPNYAKNLIEEYTRGGVEQLSGITYTHYMHQAILEHAQATGDVPFLLSQLDGLIAMYNLWNITVDSTTGLYHRNPLQDAQEYSLPGYLTGGPGGGPMQEWNDFGLSPSQGGGNDYTLIWLGPETYRPDHNAYMVAGARAISTIASMADKASLAETWSSYAEGLYNRMTQQLYSSELNFWIDVVQGTNLRCEGRELIGYFPYRFDIGTNTSQIQGLEAGLDTEHFLTEFGPTTLEQTNPYYTSLKNSTYCCMWQGQSWPFSTSVYLGTLARIARNNLSSIITSELFNKEMKKYTLTNYKDGVPYTAESHYPTIDEWSGDTANHSENYLHSTYFDNVFTNLFGIVPTFGDTLVLQPLVPRDWSYFAIENLPYHGSLLSFVWDQDGTHYSGKGSQAGFSIYSNGTLFHHQSTLGPVNVSLPFKTTTAAQQLAAQPEYQNILANPNSPYNLPTVTTGWCLSLNGDICNYPAWKMNDGLLWYDTTPDNRWTNNQSETPYATLAITLPRARKISSVSLAIFADVERGGVVDCPAGVKVVDGRTKKTVAFQNPWTDCVGNALNTISFAAPTEDDSSNVTTPDSGYTIETDNLLVTISDKLQYTTAVTEIQIWVPPLTGPRYEAEDGVIGTFIGSYEGKATGLNGTIQDGGVSLGSGGWIEIADVRRQPSGDSPLGSAGSATMEIVGGGSGTVEVGLNWLKNQTVTFSGKGSTTLNVELLLGGNVVTIFQTGGTPWIDAVVVGA